MNITYDKSVNDIVFPTIKNRIEQYAHILPLWCQNLIVFYDAFNDEGLTLSCSSEYNYRYVHITVYPSFLDDISWETSIIHEIIHAFMSPYTSKVETTIKTFINDPQLAKYIMQEITKEEESSVQDIAYLLNKYVTKVDSGNKSVL